MAASRGSEPGYRRPVVAAQSDAFNVSQIQTVIVAIITSNLRLAEAPGNVMLTQEQTGLDRESVVNVSHLITLDKRYLTEQIREIGGRRIDPVGPRAQISAVPGLRFADPLSTTAWSSPLAGAAAV